MNLRTTFDTPFEQHADRKGQPFEVVAVITQPDEHHDAEVLPMYRIRFGDGTVIEAWPEEVLAPEADRTERTVWRLTAADLDAYAGRELTDEELDDFTKAIGHSSISESLDAIGDQFRHQSYQVHVVIKTGMTSPPQIVGEVVTTVKAKDEEAAEALGIEAAHHDVSYDPRVDPIAQVLSVHWVEESE